MLKQLRNFIKDLNPKKVTTVWENYSISNTYKESEEITKSEIVKDFIDNNDLSKVIDLGCNDGFYSKIALKNNNYVVGFDYDPISIDRAFHTFGNKQKNFASNI